MEAYDMNRNSKITIAMQNENRRLFFPTWMGEIPRERHIWSREEEEINVTKHTRINNAVFGVLIVTLIVFVAFVL